MTVQGLYVHIPFCIRKCYYCDFNSYSGMEDLHDRYIDAVINEIQLCRKQFNMWEVSSIYIGGGTPTCLSEENLYRLMDACYKHLRIPEYCEISIESNPGTLSVQKLSLLKSIAINRLSIGLQTWHDDELRRLGRIHTQKQFMENFYTARSIGFENINIDLMFSLPSQTMAKWESTLQSVTSLNPEHISCYNLILEEGTKLFEEYQRHELDLPDEEVDRRMYHLAIEMLAKYGYQHYEISNFAKEGYKSRHNQLYWKCKEYLGIGAGAHSYVEGIRSYNVYSPIEYIRRMRTGCSPIEEKIILNKSDKMSEFMFMGLRMIKGVNTREFYMRFQADMCQVFKEQICKLIRVGLLEWSGKNLKLTSESIDIANQVFMEFV